MIASLQVNADQNYLEGSANQNGHTAKLYEGCAESRDQYAKFRSYYGKASKTRARINGTIIAQVLERISMLVRRQIGNYDKGRPR